MTKAHIHMLTPRLVVSGAAAAIDFYRTALGAEEVVRHAGEAGKIVHAELRLGKATITLKDEDEVDRAATTLGGSPVIISIDVADAEGVAEAMVRGGASVIYPISDMSEYGRELGGRLVDPFGHVWMIMQ